MWWLEGGFARNPLLKPVILSNTSSHLPDFKCNIFLQKLVFLLFSFINSKGSYKYPTNPRKKLASFVDLVFSPGCWSGDSPALPLGLRMPPTKALGMSLNLAIHSSVQQQHQQSPQGCPADQWCKVWKTHQRWKVLCTGQVLLGALLHHCQFNRARTGENLDPNISCYFRVLTFLCLAQV